MISSTRRDILHFLEAAISARVSLVSLSVRKVIYSVFFMVITRIHGIPFRLTVIDISGILNIS